MCYFVHLFIDMADVGHIPSEPWQIQPMTPFDISHDGLFFTDHHFPVNEPASPVVIDDEFDCNTSIDYSASIHSIFDTNRQGVLSTQNDCLDVPPPISPFSRARLESEYPIETNR